MYIAKKDFRINNKCYFSIRQGDVLCGIYNEDEWTLVYNEENHEKFGFVPTNYLTSI